MLNNLIMVVMIVLVFQMQMLVFLHSLYRSYEHRNFSVNIIVANIEIAN